jgi:HEAT repeat protein
MPAADALKAVVDRIPDPDANGTYVNLDAGKIEALEQAVADLRRGGRETVLGLIDMLVEPGKGDDIKPHFALHLLAVRATEPGGEQARAEFAAAVASQVLSDRPAAVRKYLVEQLQWAGGREVVPTLGKALLDPALCDPAARALAAIGDGAVEPLLAALPKVQGRGRLSVLKKLAVLRAEGAAAAFREALSDADPDVRIAGAWGIARIADGSAARALLEAADAPHETWERLNVTDACLALAEALAAAGRKEAAAAIYGHLSRTRTDPSDRHVREAAERGLAGVS